MNNLDETNYDVDLSDGVITFKNINTTLGFVRYNETAEVELSHFDHPYYFLDLL